MREDGKIRVPYWDLGRYEGWRIGESEERKTCANAL